MIRIIAVASARATCAAEHGHNLTLCGRPIGQGTPATKLSCPDCCIHVATLIRALESILAGKLERERAPWVLEFSPSDFYTGDPLRPRGSLAEAARYADLEGLESLTREAGPAIAGAIPVHRP